MTKSVLRCAAFATLVCVALVTPALGSGPQKKAAAKTNIDPSATELLKRMSDALAAAKSFSFQARTMSEEPAGNGQFVDIFTVAKVEMVRPNMLKVEEAGEARTTTVYYDGSSLTFVDPTKKLYAVTAEPGTVDQLVKALSDKYGAALPMTNFLFSDVAGTMSEGVTGGSVIGVAQVGDEKCYHLAFTEPAADWQVWITTDKRAVPMRLSINYKTIKGNPRVIVELWDWKTDKDIDAKEFAFTPSDDYTKIAHLPGRPVK